jgi:hypothetical protein
VELAASSVSLATAVPPAAKVSSAAMVWAAAVKMASRASAVGEGAAGIQALRKPITDPIKIPVLKICLFIGDTTCAQRRWQIFILVFIRYYSLEMNWNKVGVEPAGLLMIPHHPQNY